MEFQWVAGLTLWTVLSGPVLVDVAGHVTTVPTPPALAVRTQAQASTPATPPPLAVANFANLGTQR